MLRDGIEPRPLSVPLSSVWNLHVGGDNFETKGDLSHNLLRKTTLSEASQIRLPKSSKKIPPVPRRGRQLRVLWQHNVDLVVDHCSQQAATASSAARP